MIKTVIFIISFILITLAFFYRDQIFLGLVFFVAGLSGILFLIKRLFA